MADVLTRVLGQYLEGIDRDSVRFGAWSGLVELRGVALRPEALAVLFETLGLDLPVTVEAGFIGLLRLQVPWNAIGTTPVQIHMEDITVVARPVRGDGSDDSELKIRERRIKRAKLNTDDAVREASWGVTTSDSSDSSWGNWLVSEQLRAKIVDNIQIHLTSILLRFEDPFSNPRRPYTVSIACESLKAVSANAAWQEVFVERSADTPGTKTRKLLEVKGFGINWSPIAPRDVQGSSPGNADEPGRDSRRFETPELLKRYVTTGSTAQNVSESTTAGVKSLVKPVDGSLRLSLAAAGVSPTSFQEGAEHEPSVDLDIRFPDVLIDLDDVQYECLLQTSVYFAKLATRGFRPHSPRARWIWAIDQLLPGFSSRRERALSFTEKGIIEARDRRVLYVAYRKSVLKARRLAVVEPKEIAADLERMEDSISFEEVLALRDAVDRQIEIEGEDWKPSNSNELSAKERESSGTTVSSFWQMLGYNKEAQERPAVEPVEANVSDTRPPLQTSESELAAPGVSSQTDGISLRVAFLLRSATVRLSEGGFPRASVPRVSLNLRDFRAGVLFSVTRNLTAEAVLGGIEAWDIVKETKMVYSRIGPDFDVSCDDVFKSTKSSYPPEVSEAIDSIRRGSNPAKELLVDDEEPSSSDEDTTSPGGQYFSELDQGEKPPLYRPSTRRRSRSRFRGTSGSRESTPASTSQVTEAEFLGTALSDSASAQKYIAAFRYTQNLPMEKDSVLASRSKLDVSVATLEAVVDGPRGNFLWGLKFWEPKGMAQDPIMAFLGATAGARIAELRLELEEALLANKVPMQINAVIQAPRFVLPSASQSSPAIVVNMGTLGICTSDNAPLSHNPLPEGKMGHVRYSNYVLTLDDLGVYLAPDLQTAVSKDFTARAGELLLDQFSLDSVTGYRTDTTHVERIVRPFSLRFMLQTLRDRTVVQVARAPSATESSAQEEHIAKARVRGSIPGLYLIVSQKAVQHFLMEARRWGAQLRRRAATTSRHPPEEAGWDTTQGERDLHSHDLHSISRFATHGEENAGNKAAPPSTASIMASYDVKLLMQKVSVELRESREVRLVTAVASDMAASVVKTGKSRLHAKFTLQSWAVTDRSRGSTAAFRRLIYAGTFADSKGVSPPRSLSGTHEDLRRETTGGQNFVTIEYSLNLLANEHDVHLKFLSLNMVCVRETYARLAGFLYTVFKKSKENAESLSSQAAGDGGASAVKPASTLANLSESEVTSKQSSSAPGNISIVSEFDGFNLQLVAAGGAIAMVEMRDSQINFVREVGPGMRAWGGFRYFCVRDWTAPIPDHGSVIIYGNSASSSDVPFSSQLPSSGNETKDQWTLQIPSSNVEHYHLRAHFRGVDICFLYRFSVVLQQYFSVLQDRVQPAVEAVLEQVGPEAGPPALAKTSPASKGSLSQAIVNIELCDLHIRVPRHSGCASEALRMNISKLELSNSHSSAFEVAWNSSLEGITFAVDYVLPDSTASDDPPTIFTSPFWRAGAASISVREGVPRGLRGEYSATCSAALVTLEFPDPVLVELCEAQYTVLYFILNENLAETISGPELSANITPIERVGSSERAQPVLPVSHATPCGDADAHDSEADILILPQQDPHVTRTVVVDLDICTPMLSIELSRGWDVADGSCKVLGMYFRNAKLDFTYSSPSHMLFEMTGRLMSVADLRQETVGDGTFTAPLKPSSKGESNHNLEENVTMSYEKESGSRAIVVVFLAGLHVRVLPELLRDIPFLAIPGWPFLSSSSPAPDFTYLGRSMMVVLTGSQVLVASEQDESDTRAVVFTGEFQVKLDWMRGTGAKRISLTSTRLEVSTVYNFPQPQHCSSNSHARAYEAAEVKKIGTPLVYPTDSFIEYVDPDVDEGGCRLQLSADSVLCLVDTAEIPLLRAVFNRTRKIRPSYLLRRDWVQVSAAAGIDGGGGTEPDSKEERRRKARENMSISVEVPATRYMITEAREGRFVPVLEARLKSFDLSAHLGSMFEVRSELSMDLFNTSKGSWEPALEPWSVAASVSYGQSGTRAVVVKSEGRLNVNVTPMSITSTLAVAKALQSATKSSPSEKGPAYGANRAEEEGLSFDEENVKNVTTARRPSVAAFLVRNELGTPVNMSSRRSSRLITIANNSEIEIGVQTEDLVSASGADEGKSREDALRCVLNIPGFAAQELSASEVGKHYVTFLPANKPWSSREELDHVEYEAGIPLRVVWEVEMVNGVPVCVLRSLVQLINELSIGLEVRFCSSLKHPSAADSEYVTIVVETKGRYSIPLHLTNGLMQVRPDACRLFDWSTVLPQTSKLFEQANEDVESRSLGEARVSSERPRMNFKDAVVRCRTLQGGSSDFFISVAALRPHRSDLGAEPKSAWLDIRFRPPITVRNSLPGPLSYRITHMSISSLGSAQSSFDTQGTVLAAGVIAPQQTSDLHFSGPNLSGFSVAFAYENSTGADLQSIGSDSLKAALASNAPTRFGPDIRFESIGKKLPIVLPSAFCTVDSKGQARKEFRATLTPLSNSGCRYEMFSGFWIRNRSDTALEVCSRGSYYGSGSQLCHLRESPPFQQPDSYVCLEGPYLSLRIPKGRQLSAVDESLDHSDWWTSPSVLEDLTKPVTINLRGRSLEVEVRPGVGLESLTHIVTIRNSSWICNNTASILQWCQTSALDSHGNCIMRLVNTLRPSEARAIHWDLKSPHKAVHLRVADEHGRSDWIWSPAVPLDIGHSRELPAKMYRPKTHEQYIARVASKELAGSSRALVVYAEDRLHPPYRIVNLSQERAVAFSQIGSVERPWLVRAGKSTRYSWDNPLAPPGDRLLSVRILEPDEINMRRKDEMSSSDRSALRHRHEIVNLNIDVVGDRVMVLSESYIPRVVVNVTVDGATKIVTFCDESENGQLLMHAASHRRNASEAEEAAEKGAVPTVGWDDIGQPPREDLMHERALEQRISDYPMKTEQSSRPKSICTKRTDTDAAVFLDSIGISFITVDPVELMYVSFKGVLINYEAYSNLECLALHIRAFQVDNQLIRTPYPVLLWIPSSLENSTQSDLTQNDNAIAVEVQRNITDDDIVMIKTLKGSIQPFNVCFEDEFISKMLSFLANTSLMGSTTQVEQLAGQDSDKVFFNALLPKPGSGSPLSSRRQGVPASRRIYVHDFAIYPTSMRLTSKGSGAAVAKAAGINSSARALVAIVLNVENCEFSFPSLNVQNVFDSFHHFAILVKEYYVTQLSNQRMKLLTSNSLMGNPAALFDAVGTGARDFFAEPGRAKGSADFIASVGRGSKSLLTHTVGGIVESVSGIPRAVSSGIEKAVGDDDYLAERERIRGSNLPSRLRGSTSRNPAQGLATGAISFAHGISSGVTGLIREPVQGARQGGAGGLLKGIGKAFIGGVAKPVAGAIDLVAEPAAGLSRQIADGERSGKLEDAAVAVPERPPRSFKGRNQRLERYDRRMAVGVFIYETVQIASGVTFRSELEHWVELSDRPDRGDANSELWVWHVAQTFSRSMGSSKKSLRAETRNRRRSGGSSLLDIRPEKIRVALLSASALVIATLDCKLVNVVPLWPNCEYQIAVNAKEVLLQATSKAPAEIGSQDDASGFLSGAQSLISAPWDASAIGRRKRPSVGETVVDRVPCGSAEAGNDLAIALRQVTRDIENATGRRSRAIGSAKKPVGAPVSVELAPVSRLDSKNGQELTQKSAKS